MQVVLLAGLAAGMGWAQEPGRTLEKANAALQAGEADRALTLIASLPQSGEEIAEAQRLECRVRFRLEQWSAAVAACQQAVNLDPENSDDHLWLGRALGEKASRASFMTAYTLAKQAFQQFQTATRLNPRNAAALADLGEYYVDAPAVLGGGLDKAENVAAALDPIDPARASELRAEIAEERNDWSAAEQEFEESRRGEPTSLPAVGHAGPFLSAAPALGGDGVGHRKLQCRRSARSVRGGRPLRRRGRVDQVRPGSGAGGEDARALPGQ